MARRSLRAKLHREEPLDRPPETAAGTLGPGSSDPDRAELAAFVRLNVAEVRTANALVLAWFRLGLRVVTLALYAYAWLRYQEAPMPVAMAVNSAHILVALAVLWLLRNRRAVQAAIYAGAISDFAAVFIGAWRAAGRPDAETGTVYFMGVFELMLLFAALTLPRRPVLVFAALSSAFLAVLAVRSEMALSSSGLLLVTLVAFSLAVTWAGARMVDLAVRNAVEAYTGRLIRRHRDELQKAQDALRAAQAQAETLTQLIVHDLRNPVSTVGMSLEVLRPIVGPDGAEALEIARDEVGRLADMLGDLLVIARLEGGMTAGPVSVDLARLLEGVARAAESQARAAGVRLEVRTAVSTTRLDETLVRRMVDNLVANALRYVDSGDRIELSAEAIDGGVRIAVRNSGPPVPHELRDRIFEKYATHGRRDWRNVGLGLYLCRLVAELHGGTIAVRDREGWNVSFEADLPSQPG